MSDEEEEKFDDATNSLDSCTNKKSEIHHVSVKIPPFWSESPGIWFAQLEAQFATARVTTEKSKFNLVLANMESKVLTQVTDAVLNPPATNMYENLKKVITARYSDSEQAKMKKLLSEMALGDRKPSFLLNEMKQLAGPKTSTDFLKTLWLQNLPMQVRTILSTSDAPLEQLSLLADKIVEVTDFGKINEVKRAPPLHSTVVNDDRLDRIEKCIEQLTLSLAESQRGRSQSRPTAKNRTATPSANRKQHEFCWYHYKFGAKAQKCMQPCKFESKN